MLWKRDSVGAGPSEYPMFRFEPTNIHSRYPSGRASWLSPEKRGSNIFCSELSVAVRSNIPVRILVVILSIIVDRIGTVTLRLKSSKLVSVRERAMRKRQLVMERFGKIED